MFQSQRPVRKVTWNLSDASRSIMGEKWCENHDERQKLIAQLEELLSNQSSPEHELSKTSSAEKE
jgi:hypothetical protein